MRIPFERIFVAIVVALTLGGMAWPAVALVTHSWTPLAIGLLSAAAAVLIGRRLPARLDGSLQRRPVLALLWGVLAVVMVVQTARLGLYVENPDRTWWHGTANEFWSKHSCMNAYFYAADLHRQGETNIYDADHYGVLNPEAENHSQVEHLVPEDPYQYPPQFLLLPRALLALSDDYRAIQSVWFSVQALLFALALFLLARWAGGRLGDTPLWLAPLVWISVPSFLNFQYGQFHVTTLVLTVLAFLAFEARRAGIGGLLLGSAILAKGFPAIVLIPLALERRWRALAWTGGTLVAVTGIAWWALGTGPFEAFLQYHLPRMRSGEAFAFDAVWPEWKGWLLAGNVSPFALVRKLNELGVVTAGLDAARAVQTLFVGALLLAAWCTPWRRALQQRAVLWMAFLNLAALTSPAAWGDYIIVGTAWMATLLFAGAVRQRFGAAALLAYGVLAPGIVPLGNVPGPTVAMALSVVGTLALIGGSIAVIAPLWRGWRLRETETPAPALQD